jgi:DNA sulfur modification protein DndD
VFESRRQREDITREALKAAAATLTEELRSESFWEHELGTQPVPSLVEKFTHSVIRLINKMLPEPRQEESGVHDLSERDRNALLNAIEKILTDVPQRAISLSSKCEEAHQHLRRIEQDLQKVPREEALRPLLWELNRLQKELGQARASLEARQHQLKAAYAEREEIERKLSQLDEQLQNAAASSRAMALTTKVLGVLKLYRQALSVARVDLLGQCVTECYQALVHKRSLCSRIAFDPHTLTASLHNTTGQLVYKERLSAGEKQVLAIAILWGLGRASGRQLPVVIDAPLARLDIEHRATLLSNYFPNASHQVIVLSTDSEIDHHGFEMLKPWVAKAYRLRFDEGTGCSLVEHGYW